MLLANIKAYAVGNDWVGAIDRIRAQYPSVMYVGRKVGALDSSILQNPFRVTSTCTREKSIELYRRWLWKNLQPSHPNYPQFIYAFDVMKKDTVLVCWCIPEPCHSEVIESAWKWLQTQR